MNTEHIQSNRTLQRRNKVTSSAIQSGEKETTATRKVASNLNRLHYIRFEGIQNTRHQHKCALAKMNQRRSK